jgi:hypothetical protein
VLTDLQAEFGTVAEEIKKAKCSTAAFPKLFMFREVGTVGTQVSFVTVSTPLHENYCSTSLFTTGYKRLAEGGHEVF